MRDGETTLRADWVGEWLDVWRRDDPYNYVYDVYFDRETGALLWLDNPNTTLTPVDTDGFAHKRALVSAEPERYEIIPALAHEEHHAMFREWLHEWPEEVRSACRDDSLDRFLHDLGRHAPETVIGARQRWLAFRERRLKERAERWLKERGFEVEWG